MPATMIPNAGSGERFFADPDAHLHCQTKHTSDNWRPDVNRSTDDIGHGRIEQHIPRSPLNPSEIGCRARAVGFDIGQNPHPQDDPRGVEWERGWLHHQADEIERLIGGTP